MNYFMSSEISCWMPQSTILEAVHVHIALYLKTAFKTWEGLRIGHIGSTPVEQILKSQSWVPTSNAFLDRLGPLGFNIFCALVVDLLHEFEIGMWKMLFIHLLRILATQDKDLIHELDRRYRQVPTFSPATIYWTLDIMDDVTSAVGQQFHDFKTTEAEACTQRSAKQAAKQVVGQTGKHSSSVLEQRDSVVESQTSPKDAQHTKTFNFQTYKFHALGDYVSTIHQYGTSDLYSSEPGELEHHSPKSRYRQTDHKSFVKQLTRIKHHQACICRIGNKMVHCLHIEIAELARSPHVHHHIGATQKFPIHIGSYLISHEGAEDNDINTVILKDDQMYCHNITRFNYTTYDVRRAQDIINPRTSHCNVMVLQAANDVGHLGHKFIYSKVLGIFHVNVIYTGSGMYSFDFLDPSDVLRGCHIIPYFKKGKRHPEGPGMSGCAGDNDDWREYFLNCWDHGLYCQKVGHGGNHYNLYSCVSLDSNDTAVNLALHPAGYEPIPTFRSTTDSSESALFRTGSIVGSSILETSYIGSSAHLLEDLERGRHTNLIVMIDDDIMSDVDILALDNGLVWFLCHQITKELVYHIVFKNNTTPRHHICLADLDPTSFGEAAHPPLAMLSLVITSCYDVLLSYSNDNFKDSHSQSDNPSHAPFMAAMKALCTINVFHWQNFVTSSPSLVIVAKIRCELSYETILSKWLLEESKFPISVSLMAHDGVMGCLNLQYNCLLGSLFMTTCVLFGLVNPLDIKALIEVSLKEDTTQTGLQHEEESCLEYLNSTIANLCEELNTRCHPTPCRADPKKVVTPKAVKSVGACQMSILVDCFQPTNAIQDKCHAWLCMSSQSQDITQDSNASRILHNFPITLQCPCLHDHVLRLNNQFIPLPHVMKTWVNNFTYGAYMSASLAESNEPLCIDHGNSFIAKEFKSLDMLKSDFHILDLKKQRAQSEVDMLSEAIVCIAEFHRSDDDVPPGPRSPPTLSHLYYYAMFEPYIQVWFHGYLYSNLNFVLDSACLHHLHVQLNVLNLAGSGYKMRGGTHLPNCVFQT
ncbi:hypothetical protein BDR05DRAFT_945499 [Suillus weaverae]|nr:hypothetical protein BDR05DRAFT_945499 [Suillus weaverae]